MTIQHQSLAAGRWRDFSLVEQMAHVGSEVSRALNWLEKGNRELSDSAFVRALELMDLTLQDPKNIGRLKEPCRCREALVDFFDGENLYGSSIANWRSYFDAFAFAAAAKNKR
jgi:hypothetical protein